MNFSNVVHGEANFGAGDDIGVSMLRSKSQNSDYLSLLKNVLEGEFSKGFITSASSDHSFVFHILAVRSSDWSEKLANRVPAYTLDESLMLVEFLKSFFASNQLSIER